MNFKLIFLIIAAGVSITGYGVLANEVDLEIQKFELILLPPMDGIPIQGTSEFSVAQCACLGPNGVFDPGFCDVSYTTPPNDGPDGLPGTNDDFPGVPDPNSLGATGNKLCTWEASDADYGGLLDYDEGCSANYWKKSSDLASPDYSWPFGYNPDYLYEDIFNIGIVDENKNDQKIIKLQEKIEMYKIKINELLEQGKIKTKTAKSLSWFLEAVPLPENDEDSIISSSKIKKFYDRLDIFVDRKTISQTDRDYILEVLEDSDDAGNKKFTLLNAITTNMLNPPDDKLAKESVAAILNAAHFQVNYHYSVPEIMKMTQDAVENDMQIKTANEFKKHNLAGAISLCS